MKWVFIIISYTSSIIAVEAVLLSANNARIKRCRQIIPLLFAPVFTVYMLIYNYRHAEMIQSLLKLVPLSAGVKFILGNTLITSLYIGIKIILMGISNRIFNDDKRIGKWAGSVYEYNEQYGVWFVKDEFVNFRKNLKVILYVLCFIAALFAISLQFFPDQRYIYPFIVMVLFSEILSYLNGFTKEEYETNVAGKNAESILQGNYHKLKTILEKIFPEPALMSHTSNEIASNVSSREYIESLKKSEDETDQLINEYFTGLKENYGFYDADLIKAVNLLMHRQNVVMNNPFYEDLSDYLTLPLMNCLLSDYKVLIVVGRDSICEDVTGWVNEIVSTYNRTGCLFKVGLLNEKRPDDLDVGLLKFSDLYNKEVIKANLEYFENTDFVLMIEPSRMLAASQMGLSILAEKMNLHKEPLYCILDHYVEGLADTLSHVLQINIVNIVATTHPRSVFTVMDWKATGDFRRQELFRNEMHYLGNGIELAAAALKNQVQHVYWYAGDKAPVRDIQSLAKQYFVPVARYANIPVSQKSIDEYITFSFNPWAGKAPEQAFIIAEDEESNLFAVIREYLTRGVNQIFVNVLSENYLLRDYMRYNYKIFLSDHKAIAAIAPDYSKTERNTALQLIIEMASFGVDESHVIHELSMLGLPVNEPKLTLESLIRKYTGVEESIIQISYQYDVDEELNTVVNSRYFIHTETFDRHFSKTLKNAFFVVEDEKLEHTAIDAKLFGHITQLVMPGQLLTYTGKLYRVQSVTPGVGCILRRASDMYLSRQYYRQIRSYNFEMNNGILESRKVGDIEVLKESMDFSVSTSGYLQMKDNDDLRSAKLIDFKDSPQISAYDRRYFNKSVLKIILPETDHRIRFTVSLLMQEMFRTLFPDSWQYIAVLSDRPKDEVGMLDKYVYSVGGNLDSDAIYIVEDSEIDLGMIDAVDKNLIRIFEIMADYLNWHLMKIKEPASKDPEAVQPTSIPEEMKVKQSFLRKIARSIRRLFGIGYKKQEKQKSKTSASPKGTGISSQPQEAKPDQNEPAKVQKSEEKEKPIPASLDVLSEDDFVHAEGEDIVESDLIPDDLDIIIKAKLSRYQKECYLKFGFNEIIGKLELETVSQYLTVRGLSNGALAKARLREPIKADFIDTEAVNHCDFCGKPLTGVSYEKLTDGRVRCYECSVSAIETVDEYKEIFEQTKVMMETIYNITIAESIDIQVTDAKEVARMSGSVFRPSTGYAVRTVGFARRRRKKYSLVMENGSPRLAAVLTITHELTHIWQYLNWDKKEIEDLYGSDENVDMVYEGMAVWASIQQLYAMGETAYADLQDYIHENRDDVYGKGYRLYKEKYGLKNDGDVPLSTPFNVYPPL